MRNRESIRYARWAAAAALLLTVVVAGVYLQRTRRESRAERNAPPAIPAAVEQQSAAFSFSKVEQDRTLFTVSASHATAFKNSDLSRLDDVSITVFGREGTRNDRIHAKACDYESKSGRMICKGKTQIDLESAADARKNPGQRAMNVETSDVAFDRETGTAVTDAPATFRFPNGTGAARGVEYDSREGIVVLEHDVAFQLRPEQDSTAAVTQIQASRLDFNRGDSVMRLGGAVRVVRGPQTLTAGEMRLSLDQDLHVKRAEADESPELRFMQTTGTAVLDAEKMSADLTADGSVSQLTAERRVRGQRRTSRPGLQEEDIFSADQVKVFMDSANPRTNQPRELMAGGNVAVNSQQPGVLRTLRTAAVQLEFSSAGRGATASLNSAQTLVPGVVELLSAGEKTTMNAGRFLATFDGRGQMRLLQGKRGVMVDRETIDSASVNAVSLDHATQRHVTAARQTNSGTARSAKIESSENTSAPEHMTARELDVHYAGEDWTELEGRGDVRFRQADHSAEAGIAHIARATNTVRLDGFPVVDDANSRTTAAHIELEQSTGEVVATGRVFTLENSPAPPAKGQMIASGQPGNAGLGSGAAQISADRLEANSQSGVATYKGNARLWQEDALVQADDIRLDRKAQQLDATGHVMALLPQNSSNESSPAKNASRKGSVIDDRKIAGHSIEKATQETANGNGSRPSGPTVWTIHAPHLTYIGNDQRVHFEIGVTAQSDQGRMDSRTLDVFLKSGATGDRGVDHAQAIGNVVIEQPGRRATADRADYFAAEGKYVLSGGQPKLVESAHGTTTGRSLTYFVANDTILVDARGGSRTLTEHRIEK
jgi:lipopolysaccharide export system protein LptA